MFILGLSIGMPRFKPLNIKSKATMMVTIGKVLRSLFLTETCITAPSIVSIIKAGAVPNPKKAINPAAFNGLAVITAAANATYTNPHGNNPFKNPKK